MLGMFKRRLDDRMKQYSGNKDFLEAVCAACALTASANGLKDEEIEATEKAIAANSTLSTAYNSREIIAMADKMLKRAAGGRMGRNQLYKELEDIADNLEMAEDVMLAAVDVAEAEGGIDDEEQKVLNKIASILGQDLNKIMEV